MLSIIPLTHMTLACLHAVCRGESGRAMSSSFPGSSTKIDGKFNKFNILRYARDTMFLCNDTMNLPADDNPSAFAEVYSRSLIRSQTDVMVTVPNRHHTSHDDGENPVWEISKEKTRNPLSIPFRYHIITEAYYFLGLQTRR